MHPALNYRQSRRSACDRCRGFKLRCGRDQVNGRSCERCLKAQVVCTTSIGHPNSSFLPSKGPSAALPGGFDERLLHTERLSMPILHKSSGSKVRKSSVPSSIPRVYDHRDFGYWGDPNVFSCLSNGGILPASEDIGVPLPSYPAPALPYEQWTDHSPWTVSPYYMQQPPLEENLLDSDYHPGNLSSSSEDLRLSALPKPKEEPIIETIIPPGLESFSLAQTGSDTTMDGAWGSTWQPDVLPAKSQQLPSLPTPLERPNVNLNHLRRKILKLDLELIEDLELLDTGSLLLGSSSLLKEDINPAVGKLDLPIYRMLNHSTQFLEIIRSATMNCEDALDFNVFNSQQDTTEGDNPPSLSTDATENTIEDGAATALSLDSGYFTMGGSPADQAKNKPSSPCDISTSLSMLATYCHLVRVYRAVFAQLYRLFLIIPPADAAAFLLLPSLQFGQFHMDGNLTVQIQVLIELSSSMLSKIERALGMSYGSLRELHGDAIGSGSVLEDNSLALIKDQIMTQEHVNCGIPLKETLNCLRQLVKDPAGV